MLEVVIDRARSNAHFVAQFLNSEFGKELREQIKTGFIPKLNKRTLRELRVFVPDLQTQRRMVEIETSITAEQNTVMALQNEIAELRQSFGQSQSAPEVEERIRALARRLSGGIKQHASATLDQWFETLPFPLASILRAWQATPSQDFKTKYEHLLHFFEGAAEFVSVILLSAFSSNDAVFAPHRNRLTEAMLKQNLSFNRQPSARGGWWLRSGSRHVTCLTRMEKGQRTPEMTGRFVLTCLLTRRSRCPMPSAERIWPPSSRRPTRCETTGVVTAAWLGKRMLSCEISSSSRKFKRCGRPSPTHGLKTQMIHALHCRPRRGVFENEVAILMGSNNEFLKETRAMGTWLDVERLYLSKKDSERR